MPFRKLPPPLKANPIRARLREERPAIGTAVFSWSPATIEVAGLAGLDFVRIDTEHSWRRDESLEHLIRAALLREILPIVRIDGGDAQLVRKALELGAGGLIVTGVETVETARETVRAAKFPPQGIRGFSTLCQSASWGAAPAGEWVSWSDAEPLIGIMVEHHDVLDRLDGIMAVDGIDFAMFGPADFSMNLGLRAPARSDPRVAEALSRTVAAAKKSGKHVMAISGTGKDEIAQVLGAGASLVEVSNDLVVARTAWSNARENALSVLNGMGRK